MKMQITEIKISKKDKTVSFNFSLEDKVGINLVYNLKVYNSPPFLYIDRNKSNITKNSEKILCFMKEVGDSKIDDFDLFCFESLICEKVEDILEKMLRKSDLIFFKS